jgi:hypothetical protein
MTSTDTSSTASVVVHGFNPAGHAQQFKDANPTLATLLADPRLEVLAEQYSRHDQVAVASQSLFKSTMWRANLAVLVATITGALMMATQIGVADYRSIISAFGIISGIAAIAGSMWLFRAREGNLLESWMQSRAKAEGNRAEYFKTLADMPGPPEQLLQQFDYCREYQLDHQCAYFAKRSAESRKAAERTLRWGGYAVAVSSFSGVGGGILGFSGNSSWISVGALSVIGGALGAFANAYESMNQDRRNAAKYEAGLEALELIKSRSGETRAAVASGNADALKAFVAAVNEQLSLQTKQWMEAEQGVKASMASLDAALKPVLPTSTEVRATKSGRSK